VAVLGDWVEILIDVGGAVQAFEIAATKAGRRVEVSTGRGLVEVVETTRSGQQVRSARFMASRVVAVVEHPASGHDGDAAASGTPSRARKAPQAGPDLWSAAKDEQE
jgi:hypothetical protein